MSFLGIRKWKARAARSVSRPSWSFPSSAPSLPLSLPPPSAALSSESFESPFIVEIAAPSSPVALRQQHTRSPQVDLQFSHEPLVPADLFAAASATTRDRDNLFNPYSPSRADGAREELVVVAGDPTDTVRGARI
jgi:hypothetical protein